MSAIAKYATDLPEGHPVKAYLEENALVRTLVQQIIEVDVSNDFEHFYTIFNQLARVEKHFTRKENQLFPYLEKHGWTGLSQDMVAFHDKIRTHFNAIRECIKSKDYFHIESIVYLISDDLQGLIAY